MKTQLRERIIHGFFFTNGLLVVITLVGIFTLLIYTALPAFQEIQFSNFFTSVWNPAGYDAENYGIFAMLVSTLMVTCGALLLAIPIGIGAAAYLTEIAKPRTQEIIKPIIEILAGIPSVVIGFLGIVFIGPLIAQASGSYNGLNAINGSILLAIMALPTIISLSEDALNSTPQSYEQASLALGATPWETLIKVKIPAALSGIIAACMLGMGRAIGETMTVLMATGCAPAMPHSFFDSVRTITSTIAIELGEVAYNSTHYYAIFAVGLLLFVITFFINMLADFILHKYEFRRS